MSIQRKINPLDATPIERDATFAHLALDERSPTKLDRGKAAHNEFSTAVLSVLRFIAAAYATGEAECWEAAFRFADSAAAEDGPLLVARVAALVRAIRRHHDPICLPPSCSGLSIDERHIMMLIGLARDNDRRSLGIGASDSEISASGTRPWSPPQDHSSNSQSGRSATSPMRHDYANRSMVMHAWKEPVEAQPYH